MFFNLRFFGKIGVLLIISLVCFHYLALSFICEKTLNYFYCIRHI